MDECMAVSLKADAPPRSGCVVLAGDAFMYARSRNAELPPGADLTACLNAAELLEEQQDVFDCEISIWPRAGPACGFSDRAFPSAKVIA